MYFIKPDLKRDRSHVTMEYVRHISDLLMHIHFKHMRHFACLFTLLRYEWHLKSGWRWPANAVLSTPRQANCLLILVLSSRPFSFAEDMGHIPNNWDWRQWRVHPVRSTRPESPHFLQENLPERNSCRNYSPIYEIPVIHCARADIAEPWHASRFSWAEFASALQSSLPAIIYTIRR